MSIGEALAEARDQAGLSVDQVSQQTRIRPVIIRGIEAGDYSVCGGDFYARGHIRSIAQAVGTDPGPLIEEYDRDYRSTGPIAATGLDELVARSREPRRPRLSPALLIAAAVVVVLGAAGYFFAGGPNPFGSSPQAAPGHSQTGSGADTSADAAQSGHTVVVRVTATRGTWVVFTTPDGGYISRSWAAAGASVTWTLHRAVHIKLADPGAVRMTVNGKNPLAARAAAAGPVTLSLGPGRPVTVATASSPGASSPGTQLQTVKPVSASGFGGGGTAGDNSQNAGLAIDGNPGTAWRTDWYSTPRFGNLYPGTGLLLDMGHQVTVDKVRIKIGPAQGTHFQIRVGSGRDLAQLPVVARSAGPGGVLRLRLASPAQGRYVLVWFTVLPPDPGGTFQASVFNVVVRGHG